MISFINRTGKRGDNNLQPCDYEHSAEGNVPKAWSLVRQGSWLDDRNCRFKTIIELGVSVTIKCIVYSYKEYFQVAECR